MIRRHINTSLGISVLLFFVPGFLFGLPGHNSLSALGEPQALAENTGVASGPIQSGPHIVQYFEAYQITSGVELTWSAISEKDISGFGIYRRDPDTYHYLLINREGLIGPWRMTYVDADIQPATTYQYALGVVHTDGSEIVSHPVEVTTRPGHSKRRPFQSSMKRLDRH